MLFATAGLALFFPSFAISSSAVVLSTNVSETRAVDDFNTLITVAYTLFTQKKYDEALTKCAEAAKLRPTDNRPWAISGLIYSAKWEMNSASDAFATAISFSPQNEKLHYMKARADRFRNAHADALISVRKAIELNPSFAEAYLLLGDILGLGGGSGSESVDAFKKAIELQPDLVSAYPALGYTLQFVEKDEKTAEQVYRTGIEVDPHRMAGRFELGRLLVKQGRLKEARDLWDKRRTDKDNTYPNFITLLERAEKLERAKAHLARKPDDPEAIVQMGLMVMDGESWVVDGRQEKAIVYFNKALAINPHFAKAQFAIVKAWIEVADTYKKKSKNVDEELAKLKALDPTLAAEAEVYRKSYSGGLKGVAPPTPAVVKKN